jgi:hypothetical protein
VRGASGATGPPHSIEIEGLDVLDGSQQLPSTTTRRRFALTGAGLAIVIATASILVPPASATSSTLLGRAAVAASVASMEAGAWAPAPVPPVDGWTSPMDIGQPLVIE